MKNMMNPIKLIQAWDLNRKQESIRSMIEKYGLTDDILDEQVKLNQRRRELNIPDSTKVINDGFVQ
ncbi:hypothetical protein [Methanobrevibacter sp.]|uniref:hypothetical protein n=1 Tax=Methanobrevibacter sp. TaxID=66852 RepID=UPI0038671BA3